jgi:hypothetical protein
VRHSGLVIDVRRANKGVVAEVEVRAQFTKIVGHGVDKDLRVGLLLARALLDLLTMLVRAR